MDKWALMDAVEEIYARVENIRIDVSDGDKDAVIEETRAIEAVLNRIRRAADLRRILRRILSRS